MITTKAFNNFFDYKKVSGISCFLAGALYCAGLTYSSLDFWHNSLAVFFIVFLSCLFFLNLRNISDYRREALFLVLTQLVLINLGIVVSAKILSSPQEFFWVQDSMTAHLPESLKYSEFFKGNFNRVSEFFELSGHQGFTTHTLTGLFLSILGKEPYVTVLAQIIFKVIASISIFSICKTLWNDKTAFLGVQLYAFCPTVFFYNLVLYKEGAVQALLGLTIFFTLQVFMKRKYLLVTPLLITFWLLSKERFYLAYLLLSMSGPLAFLILPKKKNLRFVCLVIIFFLGLVVAFQYRVQIYETIAEMSVVRSRHASYSDFLNKYNYEIPYPIAFVKILFSPYFTPNKFSIFRDFSLLLIWGSFINQIIILSSLAGFVAAVRRSWSHLFIWAPFIFFLLFAAYIAPWSGRLRDSFYPLIACYAAFFLANNQYFQRRFIRSGRES